MRRFLIFVLALLVSTALNASLAACRQISEGGSPSPRVSPTFSHTPALSGAEGPPNTPKPTEKPTETPTPAAPAEIQTMKIQLTNLGVNATISQDANSDWHITVIINNQPVEITNLTNSTNYDILYASTNQGLFFYNQETKTFQEITNPNEIASLPEALQQAWEEVNAIQVPLTQSVYEGNVWGVLPEGVTEADWSQKQQALFNESLSVWKNFLLANGQVTDANIDNLNLLQAVFKYVRENDQTKETNLPLWIANFLLTQQKVEDIAWIDKDNPQSQGILFNSIEIKKEWQIKHINRIMGFDGNGGYNTSEWQNMVVNGVLTKGITRPPPAEDYGTLEAVIPIAGSQDVMMIIGHPNPGQKNSLL